MHFETTSLLLLGLLAAGANLTGGLLILPAGGAIRRSELLLKSLVATGAGFLLAVIFIEIVPRAAELWLAKNPSAAEKSEVLVAPMLLLLGGYLLINFFEQSLIPHLHLESHSKAVIARRSAYAALGGLLFHSFFDGLALASAAAVDFNAGILVFLAIFLHKLPEGFTAVSLVLAAGESIKKAIAACGVIGLATLLGVAVFALIETRVNVSAAYVLPFSAGVTLYVAASELIPELYHHGERNRLVSVFVFAGVLLFFALHFLLQMIAGT